MKTFLRNILVNFIAMFSVSQTLGGIDYSQRIFVLLLASLYLSIFNLIIKPLLNLLLMPINLLTLGAFKWIINIIVLFLVTLAVNGFHISQIVFPGVNLAGFIVPYINLSLFWSLILVSFIIEALSGLINWLLR